jgi:hypothetical protein
MSEGQVHHLQYRRVPTGDHMENLIALCVFCDENIQAVL